MGVMDLLERTKADGGWQPVYKTTQALEGD